MRLLITGDWHLEAGSHLGSTDPELGSTRLRDAQRILGEMLSTPVNGVIFLGDLSRTATPGPMAYRIAQEALGLHDSSVLLLHGNHDHHATRESALHVVAAAVGEEREVHVVDRPQIVDVAGVQVGCLPWTVPARLFAQAPHNPRAMNRLVSERLVDVARGLAADLDPARPSLLIGHWLLSGGRIGALSVTEVGEPVVPAEQLVGPWDLVLFGHNHQRQEVMPSVWHVGPPMRGGFGEGEHRVGWAIAEWFDGEAGHMLNFVDSGDRELVTVDVDAEAWLVGALTAFPDVEGAVVRVRYTCTERQAQAMSAGPARALVEDLMRRGAVKVVGPQVTVLREREARSDLTVETDPLEALDVWMESEGIEDDLRARARDLAVEVTS